jgi:uncharacterized protein YfaS (alpha-2-macroglobulin family)
MIQRGKWFLLGAVALSSTISAGVLHNHRPPAAYPTAPVSDVNGLLFRLSPGKASLGSDAPIPLAETTPLSSAEADRVLARLKPLTVSADDTSVFALRESSLPPPRAGETISTTFPPPPSDGIPPAVETGALTVRRLQPEGDVPLADRVSVTFSQPMVAVSSQEEAAKNVPVTLTPSVPGVWRWLGTQTLLFDAGSGKRLPMATTYRVTVPAGTMSANGGKLTATRTATFQTPAVRLLDHWPDENEPQPQSPLIWAAFDQRVDADAVLKTVTLSANGQTFAARRASLGEMAVTNASVRARFGGIPLDRIVAFKPALSLPNPAHVTVNIGPGTPSREGPRVTDSAQTFTFETYGALKLSNTYGDGEPPSSALTLVFNNSLDEDAFDPASVKITPPLPGHQVMVQGQTVTVLGPTKGRATYRVTVSATLRDIFGQILGSPLTHDFKIGPAIPSVQGPAQSFIVCDPAAAPRAAFQSVNTPAIRVRLYAVAYTDWAAYLTYLNRGRADRGTPPGRQISDRIVSLKTPADQWGETSVPLDRALPNGRGNVIVQWEATSHRKDQAPDRGAFWAQATHLGLMAERDDTDFYAWVTDLATGKPVGAASVELISALPQSATTAADGLAHVALGDKPARFLVARQGGETAFLPSSQWQWDDASWVKRPQSDQPRWFIFDDRKLYRPGETAHIKGWARTQTAGKTGDLALPTGLSSVSWTLTDAQGNEVRKGNSPVNAWAGFDFAIDLPKTMNLGEATLNINGAGHTLTVQEFRRPEFEVSAKNEGAGPFVVGDANGADVSVLAKYYAGGPLPGTPVTWNVTATPTYYTPPGREEFTFGKWTPWWGGADDSDVIGFSYRGFGRGIVARPAPAGQTLVGKTGSDGTHDLHLDFDAVNPARPYTVSAEAVVQDINRQTRAASTSLIVHPSARYIGLKAPNLFVEQGKPLSLAALVCDIDGKADAGRSIQFHAARKTWGYVKGRWRESEVDVDEWSAKSGSGAITTGFTPKAGGTWVVRATVRDDRERSNESELTLWVSGGDGPKDKQRSLGQEAATLIPNKKEYRAGDTATILVQSPFPDAEGLATIVHDGVVRLTRFTMKGGSYTLHVPISETFLPAVGVQVDLVGSARRTAEDGTVLPGIAARPAYASGHLDISVPPTARRLTVTAVPGLAALEPGGKTTIAVTVRDSRGRPVPNAEAAVVVVDESVLALAGWNLGDPLAAFYPGRETTVETRNLREFVVLEDPAHVTTVTRPSLMRPPAYGFAVTAAMAAPHALFRDGRVQESVSDSMAGFAVNGRALGANGQGLSFGGMQRQEAKSPMPGQPETPITLRSNFDALAAFAPSVKTDADGTARVPITLPDNLTRYRIVAVAVAGAQQIGHGEAALTARLALMARPSAPRFLNFGDRFELPVVLQNQTDDPMTVDVAVRGANLAFPSAHGYRVTVKANDRAEVRFPAEAVLPGIARFQVAASAGNRADAAELSLPVWTPATTEAFATYGVVDKGAVVQPVQAPENVVPQFGGLEVTTTSTALQELTDALIYLQEYPYGCAEQISSRILATAALKDVLTAFKAAELPKPDQMQSAMDRDMARLTEMQNDDGGFGFWTRYTRPYPYVGVHVAHALVLAKQKGFAVPAPLYERSMSYIKAIETKFDGDYSPETRRCITAYALYVRHLAGDTDAARARRMLAEASLDNLGPEVVGWLLSILPGDPAMVPARLWLDNHATETAGAAHFTFSYADAAYLVLSSNRRADAIVLDALITDQPKSDLIPKLVRGLLDGRVRGHWSGTQEDAFVLLALDRYFRTYEAVTPDFVARLFLGAKVAGEGQFRGRTTDRVATQIPMAYLARTPGVQKLTIDKVGAGRLYYRVGMRYAPRDLSLKPADYGFSVHRVYEAIDKPGDVRRDPDGTWVIRAGAKVRVRLTMIATTRRYHVALTDPTPAGFEALNSELQGTESVDPGVVTAYGWRWGQWWEHENLRDERAEAFTSYLYEGAYDYAYVCRATTPGEFIVPPAKAEEMYAPETFGRSGTDHVRVE